MKRLGVLILILAVGGTAQGLRFWGTWDMTLELLPTLRIYGSTLLLNCSFAPGWRIESETKIYAGGEYRYQNFYISGSLGDIGVWGKIYFHAQEIRYQKVWINAETKFGDLTARLSFNHWAKFADYTATDREMFGDWPCYTLVPAHPVIKGKDLEDLVATWEGAADPRVGKKYYIQGRIVAYWPSTPTTYVNLYLVANYPSKRFIVYIRFADFSPPITPGDVLARLGASTWPEVVDKEICVFGTLVNYTLPAGVHNPEIILAQSPGQLNDLNLGACQPTTVPVLTEPFINWRYRLTWGSYLVNIDFGDCCAGTFFRRLQVDASGLPLCCGLFFDLSLSFTKSGFDKIALTLGDLSLCCGVTAKIALEFTPTAKKVELKPAWHGLAGCFTIYGDALFSQNAWQGLEVWGFMANCYFPACGYFRILTAFDPAKFWIDENRNITASRTRPSYYSALFRTGEFEYMSAKFCMPGCCGGEVAFILESWFGSGAYLFGFRRFKLDFQLPIATNITLFSKAQWDFTKVSPLEWFDVGWTISF